MKNPVTERLDRWFKRNAIGEQKESEGKFEDAIRAYEANVEESADTLFSYERLVILYKRRNDQRNEIRIIRKALAKLSDRARRKPLDAYLESMRREFTRRLKELTGEKKDRLDPSTLKQLGLN
jgi:hypothetical protein